MEVHVIIFLITLILTMRTHAGPPDQYPLCIHSACKYMFEGLRWLSCRMLDSRSRGCGFKPHQRHCLVSLGMTLYPPLSTDSTQENPSWHDWKIVDWEVRNQIKYIEYIYFFEVNIKYIFHRVQWKNQYFSRVCSQVKMLIFHHRRWNIFGICWKKVNFLFILYSTEIHKVQPNYSPHRFSFNLTFSECLLGITLGVKKVCT